MAAPFSPVPCPKCGEYSQPHDWNEVDIGVGVQTFDHTWVCKNHGEFSDNGAFRDEIGEVLASSAEGEGNG